MAEAVGSSSSSCPPFSGDERSLFATLSGVVTVFMIFLAQAADLMNVPVLERLVDEPNDYFEKIRMAMLMPGLGAFSSSVDAWRTSWKLEKERYWCSEPLEAMRGNNGRKLYWNPRTLKALMTVQVWIAYSRREVEGNPRNAGNDGYSTNGAVGNLMDVQEEAASNLNEQHTSELSIHISSESAVPPTSAQEDSYPPKPKSLKDGEAPHPLPQTWSQKDKPPKPKTLKDVEATRPLKIQGKQMLCYKLGALSIKDGGGSHAPRGGAGNPNERDEHHIVPVSVSESESESKCDTNNPVSVSDEDVQLEQCVISLDPTQKQALLQLGFVPVYEELKSLRAYTSWGMMLLGLQSLGYIVGGMIRIFEKRIMSPMEVVAMYLSGVSLLQVLFQTFGGIISSQRTVLIHLTPPEFSYFRKQVKHIQEADEMEDQEQSPSGRKRLCDVGYVVIHMCSTVLPSAMVAYYSAYFMKAAHLSRLCFASAVFFSFLLFAQPYANVKEGQGPLLLATTVALAAAGTIKDWKNVCLNEPSSEWYSVLIPHVGNF